jgi:Regulator of chromosome condensation (RCC1) repeat
MRQVDSLIIGVSALLLAACADAPTRPPERSQRAGPDANASLSSAARLAFHQVSVGNLHTCGVTTDNVAYCWGSNGVGQLGIGNHTGPELCGGTPCSTRPVAVVAPRP